MSMTSAELNAAFTSLAQHAPFLGVAITLGSYFVATRIHWMLGSPVFLHPILLAILATTLTLQLAGIEYDHYFQTAQPLHQLLAPVVVLLAVPLWRQWGAIRRAGPRLIIVLTIGAITGILTSAGVAVLLEAPGELVATLAPKSVTTPVAMQLSEGLNGIPAITALVVILTGLVGATLGWPLLTACGLRDAHAKGFAIGLASHVIGTARVLQIDQSAGAFSGLGMILNALMTALLLGAARFVLG